jgi:hypothetical protein
MAPKERECRQLALHARILFRQPGCGCSSSLRLCLPAGGLARVGRRLPCGPAGRHARRPGASGPWSSGMCVNQSDRWDQCPLRQARGARRCRNVLPAAVAERWSPEAAIATTPSESEVVCVRYRSPDGSRPASARVTSLARPAGLAYLRSAGSTVGAGRRPGAALRTWHLRRSVEPVPRVAVTATGGGRTFSTRKKIAASSS